NNLIDVNEIKKIQKDDYNIFIITSIDKKIKVKSKTNNLVNWYRCLDHLNAEDIIKLLHDPPMSIIISDNKKKLGFCKACMKIKHHKRPFDIPIPRARRKLEWIFMNIYNGGKTLENPKDLISIYKDVKYF